MKHLCPFWLCLSLFFCLNASPVQATEFWAKNYIVMESLTHQVLEGKAIHEVQSVASISKIMTAIVAIEQADLDKVVTIGDEIDKAYGSGVYIHKGDTISLRDLLYGTMLRSGNDAALCLAYHSAGSIEVFVELMNEKARELGMTDTHFANPTGLDEEDDGNQSSVYDMALLMSYCMANPIFREVTATKSYQREDGNGTWHNKNKLLENYDYSTGGKTGFTRKAKRTLVSSARKNDLELIVVTFNCGDDFAYHQALYENYFAMYENVLCIDQGVHRYGDYTYEVKQPVYLLWPIDEKKPELQYETSPNERLKISTKSGQLLGEFVLEAKKQWQWDDFWRKLLCGLFLQ